MSKGDGDRNFDSFFSLLTSNKRMINLSPSRENTFLRRGRMKILEIRKVRNVHA